MTREEKKKLPKSEKPSTFLSILSYGIEMTRIYLDRRVSRSAAALSYYLTLSLFPALLCLYYALGTIFPSTNMTDYQQLALFMPAETASTITDYLQYISQHNSTTLLVIGVVAAITTAAGAFRSLHKTMGDLQGGIRYKGFWSYFGSFIFSVIFMAVIYCSIVAMAVGNNTVDMIMSLFGLGSSSSIVRAFKFPIIMFAFILILFILYKFTAPKNIKGTFFPGAAVASIVIVLVSILFSYFIDESVKYSLVYGTMASIIIYMLWMYIVSTILIMGNALNVVLRDHRAYNASLEVKNVAEQT